MPIRRNVLGKPVSGEDFFGREREQRRMWRYLETDNLLLLSPRRVGKSSLMLRLQDTAEQHGFQATYLSAADVRSEVGFVEKLYQAVQAIESARSALKRIENSEFAALFKRLIPKKASFAGLSIELAPEADDHWERLGRALVDALDRLDGRWLFLIDELPIFALRLIREDPSGDRARHFLNWFRQLRLGPRGSDNVRWMLAGSIGLDTVAELHNLSDTINDLHLVGLGPFSPDSAARFLSELADAYEMTLSDELRAVILERLGWPIPFFLQLVFSKLLDLLDEEESPPITTCAHVDRAFEILLEPSQRGYFDHWRQRLHEQLGAPLSGAAIALLIAIARPENGASLNVLRQTLTEHIQDPAERTHQLPFLLRMLESDGYLVRGDERYHFRSPLLRAFWLRYSDA